MPDPSLWTRSDLAWVNGKSINADSLKLQLLTARKKGVVAGHSRQFTPGGLPDNCETHCVSGNRRIEPTTFRS